MTGLATSPFAKASKAQNKLLVQITLAVVVPLSVMMQGDLLACFRPYEIRQWASAQRHVEPDDVLEYVSKWGKENPPECNGDRNSVEDRVVFAHTSWIKQNPEGTLGDLLEFLDAVRYEMKKYDGDELIADHIHDLGDAANYLADFGDDDEDQPDFDCRLANVDEDLEHVEGLIAFDGESFKVVDLPTKEDLLNRMRKVAG